jgi:hypothetical protein
MRKQPFPYVRLDGLSSQIYVATVSIGQESLKNFASADRIAFVHHFQQAVSVVPGLNYVVVQAIPGLLSRKSVELLLPRRVPWIAATPHTLFSSPQDSHHRRC